MGKLILPITLSLIICFSCVKKDNDPGCDVKGTWMGRWSAGIQEGSFVCNAQNKETDMNGYVFIWFDLPSLENHGIGFDGLLVDKQVSAKVDISGVDLIINGNVEASTTAKGTFNTNIGLSGTWQGTLMPTIDLAVVDSFPLDFQYSYNLDVACDYNRKHLFVGNGNEVKEYSYSGGLIRSFSIDYSGSFCFDGNHLWYSDMSRDKIVEIDTFGNMVSEFSSPVNYNEAIIYDEGNFDVVSNYSRKMYKISKTGTFLGELDYSYINISGLCKYQDGYLAIASSVSGTLFYVNSLGVPEKAIKFTNGYCYGLSKDGEYIWCAVERYINTSTNPNDPPSEPRTDIKIFKLKINS